MKKVTYILIVLSIMIGSLAGMFIPEKMMNNYKSKSDVVSVTNAELNYTYDKYISYVRDSIRVNYADSLIKEFSLHNQVRKYKSRKAHYENQEYGHYGYPWVCETRWGERTCHREKTWYTTEYRYEFAWWDTTWTEGFKDSSSYKIARDSFVITRSTEIANNLVKRDTVIINDLEQLKEINMNHLYVPIIKETVFTDNYNYWYFKSQWMLWFLLVFMSSIGAIAVPFSDEFKYSFK